MAAPSRMKPGAGGGPIQNAKAQAQQRQLYGKGSAAAQKHPPKKAGLSGDGPRSRKGSPLAGKKK